MAEAVLHQLRTERVVREDGATTLHQMLYRLHERHAAFSDEVEGGNCGTSVNTTPAVQKHTRLIHCVDYLMDAANSETGD